MAALLCLACICRVSVDCCAAAPSVHYFLLLLARCCSSLMNHDVTMLTMLCCRVLTLVCCLPVHGRSGWHLVAQHITSHMVVYVLARGCPTHRSGTWLPNLPTWHTVASHIDMVYDWHLVAQLYGPAHGCPTLRHAIWSAHGCPPCVLVNPAVHII